jgi:protoporphyrinogen oxidase
MASLMSMRSPCTISGRTVAQGSIRLYSSSPNRHVTVLGAGLTGLYAAYRLSSSPNIKVTLLDTASRVGGWVDSRSHPVKFTDADGQLIEGRVTLESGPRSIRPKGSRGAPTMLKLVCTPESRSKIQANIRYET